MRWRMHPSEFDFDVRYKKDLLNMQADDLFRLCSLREPTVLVDADISTYPLYSNTTPDSDGKEDFNTGLATTTDTTPSFVIISLEEVRLSQNDVKILSHDACSSWRGEEGSLRV